MEKSLNYFGDKFFELEKEFNLLDLEIDGVKPWQFQRVKIFHILLMKSGINSEFHSKKDSLLDLLFAFPKYLLNAFIKNPLKENYHKYILVFDHPRKKKIGNEFVDIYTHYLIKSFKKEDFDVIESSHLRKHFSKKATNRKYLDFLSIKKFIPKKRMSIILEEDQKNEIKQIDQKISDIFSVNINLLALIIDGVKNYKCDYKFYNTLIKKRQPKKIFLVISYGFGALIQAAKDNNVETIEIQHGAIGKYHMGYNFPNSNSVSYFPDCFYSFGEFWINEVTLPISNKNVTFYGFPHLLETKNRMQAVDKKQNQILIISQGSIGKSLADFMLKANAFLQDYHILYKLHPGEFIRWETDYPSLVLLSEQQNIEIIEYKPNKDLYYYFSESEFQIGVYSTAIFEGLIFGCKTVLVELPGIENMSGLIDKQLVMTINKPEEIISILKNFKINSFSENYIFNTEFNEPL